MTDHNRFRDHLSEALLDAGLALAIAVIIVVPLILVWGLPL